MLEEVKFRGWVFEVDRVRTEEVYSNVLEGGGNVCKCDFCRNYAKCERSSFILDEVKLLFRQLGIDINKECEVVEYRKYDDGKHLYGAWYHFKGLILEEPKKVETKEKLFDPGNIKIVEGFEIGFGKGNSLTHFNKDEYADLIQVEIFATLPWLLNTTSSEISK